MIRIFTCLILLYCSFSVSAQTKGSLSGTIKSDDNVPIEGASIRLLNTVFGTATNSEGEFTIRQLPAGVYQVQISAIGYAGETLEVTVSVPDQNSIEVSLRESAKQLDIVVVTAEKSEEDIQRVPVSVTSLSTRDVTQFRLWNNENLTAIVPSLYTGNSGDNRNVTSIRGITSTSYDPAVVTYIDGVNQFSLDTYIAQLFDIERIEVLRGPQGTLYGRNAMGGVINITTKQPSNVAEGFVEANIGSYGQQRYGGAYRMPLVSNKLYLGISGVYESADGFYTNEFTDSDFDRKKNVLGNYFIKYFPAENWSLTLNAKHNHNRNFGAFPLAGSVEDAFDSPYTVNQNATTELVDNVYNGSLSINHSGASINFSSITAIQSNYRYYRTPIDADFSPLDIVTISNDYGKDWNNVRAYTQEFKFSSPATATRLKWTAGLYLFQQENPVKQTTHFGENADLFGAQPMSFIVNTARAESKGVAIFGQLSYHLTDKLSFTGGMRYDREKKNQSVVGEYGVEPDPPFTIADTTANVTFDAVSPRASLAYQLSDKRTVYITYNRGFRTGGLTQFTGDPSQPPLYSFQPEYSNGFEAGSKNIFLDNKLNINLTLFYTSVDDVQIPTLVLPEAITITRNAGALTTKGVEIEMSATPITGLHINYNFAYTDARFNSGRYASMGGEIELNGNRQIFTPDITSMFAIQYDHILSKSSNSKVFIRGEWMHVGEQYFDLANTIRQSPYNVINARMGVAARQFELSFWIRNLSDTQYIAYAYDFGATHLGDPRNMGFTLRGNF